jgi:hypothetical protein
VALAWPRQAVGLLGQSWHLGCRRQQLHWLPLPLAQPLPQQLQEARPPLQALLQLQLQLQLAEDWRLHPPFSHPRSSSLAGPPLPPHSGLSQLVARAAARVTAHTLPALHPPLSRLALPLAL